MQSLEDIVAEVDKWFAEEVAGPPVSYHTEIYNKMHEARNSLKSRLTALITGGDAKTTETGDTADQTAGASSSKSSKAG